MTKLTDEDIGRVVASVSYHHHGVLTIAILCTSAGFYIVGKSACVNPDDYDRSMGERLARDDAVNQLWAFEGYRAKLELFDKAEATKRRAEVHRGFTGTSQEQWDAGRDAQKECNTCRDILGMPPVCSVPATASPQPLTPEKLAVARSAEEYERRVAEVASRITSVSYDFDETGLTCTITTDAVGNEFRHFIPTNVSDPYPSGAMVECFNDGRMMQHAYNKALDIAMGNIPVE